MIDVSIIFVNYNTISLLSDSIESVLDKTHDITYELIVVDNNSIDNSRQILWQKFSDRIIYKALPENIGFGRANNEGIKIATGRNIFLLNPDTILVNNAVKTLSDFLDKNPQAGVCGGNLYTKEMEPIFSHYKYQPSLITELNILLNGPLEFIFKNIQHNYLDYPIEVGFVSGADFMTRKAVLDEVGLFDADFFMYYEETELLVRIKKKGYTLYNVPSAKIVHLEGQSFEFKEHITLLMLNSRNIFYRKAYGSLHISFCNIVNLVTIISRLILFKLLNKKVKHCYWQKRLKLFVEARKIN